MENTLIVVAAVAALVAIVATAVASRAGRRARRAADLVSQLLEPPVVEPGTRAADRPSLVAPAPEAASAEALGFAAPDAPVEAAEVEVEAAAVADVEVEVFEPEVDVEVVPVTATSWSDQMLGDQPELPDSAVDFESSGSATSRRGTGPGAAFDRSDPAPARIPVLDLDRLRSWLTLGDVNLGRLAVVSVELDNLTFVQERLGYAAGSHLLEAITQRLRTVTRPRDVVAHVNQERFVLVCRDVPDHAAAEGLAERIAMGVAHPSVVLAGVAEVTASIGVALATSLDERPESVLRRAIKAGNHARARRRTDRDQRRCGVDHDQRGRVGRRHRS